MIRYQDNIDGIRSDQLSGFFAGWTNPPSPATLLKLLSQSSHRVIAIGDRTGQVVGFVNAVSDQTLSVYIPLLEVLPEYQKKGIGSELIHRILGLLQEYYMVDVVCDDNLRPFYERFGLKPFLAMSRRNFERQSGR